MSADELNFTIGDGSRGLLGRQGTPAGATGDFSPQEQGNIIRHIASFLTLSTDAASLGGQEGFPLVASWSSFITTPETPGLMALSPDEMIDNDEVSCRHEDDELLHRRIHDRQRRYVTHKLAAAVFSHPQSLRKFCVKAHRAATAIHKSKEHPETFREPQTQNIIKVLIRIMIQQNVPISVTFHLLDALRDTLLDTSYASVILTVDSINALAHEVLELVHVVLGMFTKLHFSAASDVLVSGIQSVATGVGSAAFSRLSREQHAASHISSSDVGASKDANQKLIEKLRLINSAAYVVSYREREDEVLSRHAKKRVQRMMHYDVSLRPFVATLVLPEDGPQSQKMNTFNNIDFTQQTNSFASEGESPPSSPLMCTPRSFPPTPASRAHVMARGTRFAEDVIFLARDKLRIEDGLESDNEQTRALAVALREARRLAVFNAADIGNGLVLTCGQHVATKVGSILYCSTRSMVPVLRNSFAYFEITILPMGGSNSSQPSMTTLSVGLSTLEMPLNTLVGAWKGSVGLCSTGQILVAGQWCTTADPIQSSYGENATVGCLVCLDDGSAFETWDGVMVSASVTFNVNGMVIGSLPSQDSPTKGSSDREFEPFANLAEPPTLSVLVPVEEELFPTVTLHSTGTQVMCRFSSEDVRASSREQIGAPAGVPVYAVDGSILF